LRAQWAKKAFSNEVPEAPKYERWLKVWPKKFRDPYCKHQTFTEFPYKEYYAPYVEWRPGFPMKGSDNFIAPSATIAGNVRIGSNSSIWYGCIIVADTNRIMIGTNTNVQDGTVIRESKLPLNEIHDGSTIIENDVTIGHNCYLTACTVESGSLVGMGSILEEGSTVEHRSMLAGGSVLKKGATVPSGQLWIGNPAKYFRDLTHEEQDALLDSSKHYILLGLQHESEFLLDFNPNYRELEKEGSLPKPIYRPDWDN
jgi:carbonic anhydrase/acetyltransferase-like protein (isoleucine patch superfamily)